MSYRRYPPPPPPAWVVLAVLLILTFVALFTITELAR